MRMRSKRVVRRRAFTLLEVLMVIVILGVLAAVLITQFGGTQDAAFRDLTKSTISGLASTMERYKLHCSTYPTELKDLVVKPDDEALAEKWAGPYVKEIPKDAWSRELKYRVPGQMNPESYDLYSAGKDGVEGNEDDLGNWEKNK